VSPSSNTVNDAANLIRERIRELDSERGQLERALASLTGGREGRRGPGRPRGQRTSGSSRGSGASRSSGSTRASRGSSAGPKRRRRRGGTRADQAVNLVKANPGIAASEIAKRMKIKPNYLYRVLGGLEKEGRVRKDGRTYHPAG
jgi:sugar-specific transcriptional regulator TrmB